MLWFAVASHAATSFHTSMIDKAREREVSIVIYENKKKDNLPVVIINHGYGVKNTEYSFIANALADRGYFIVSIQHDLESDVPLPRTGNLFERRKPLWERGVQNISFVMNELKKEKPNLNLNQIILIGHSNGGDISMMFIDKYSEKVSKVISLDSLRYPFPADKNRPILHFSANDTKADHGVIPDKGVKTIAIEGAKHMDFCDRGAPHIKEQTAQSIVSFLKYH